MLLIEEIASTDKLCFDGQRMIAISGDYGQGLTQYRTELDGYVTITQRGGSLTSSNTYFETTDRNGTMRYYQDKAVPGGQSSTLSWQITRQTDLYGNSIHYVYKNYASGELLLERIRYTGNNASLGNRAVEFNYVKRDTPSGVLNSPPKINDFSSSYIAGGLSQQTQRLDAVTTCLLDVAVQIDAVQFTKLLVIEYGDIMPVLPHSHHSYF